jgi:hypothetical protein
VHKASLRLSHQFKLFTYLPFVIDKRTKIVFVLGRRRVPSPLLHSTGASRSMGVCEEQKRRSNTRRGGMAEESIYFSCGVCVCECAVHSKRTALRAQVVGLNSPTERTQTGRLTHAVTHKTDWLAHIALTSLGAPRRTSCAVQRWIHPDK